MAASSAPAAVEEVHILWISEGMSCDGDSVSITAAGQPGIEDVLLGAIPGLPKVHLHNKVLSPTLGGEEFLKPFRQAVAGELDAPFVLVIEGSIPNENINGDGYWTSFGNDEATGEPLTINWWIDRLAPKAWGVVAIGTCATYGGIHAMAGNPTGCMGLADYLGWDFRSAGGLCIDGTMPGFPDKVMPFMDAPPGGGLSSAVSGAYGPMIRKLRAVTNRTVNKEPKWRHNRQELTTGYAPRWGN